MGVASQSNVTSDERLWTWENTNGKVTQTRQKNSFEEYGGREKQPRGACHVSDELTRV